MDNWNVFVCLFSQLDPVITSTYEGIQIYGQELRSMQASGLDYRNGVSISSRIRGAHHETDLGRVIIGVDGQRDMDYDVQVSNYTLIGMENSLRTVQWRV